jgi:prevent-host-death family protein
MLKQYSIASARNRLPALVHDVERGPAVQLTRRGKPVAVLLSIDEYERIHPGQPDFWEAVSRFREESDLEELRAEEVWADVRDRSAGRDPGF